MKSDEINNKNCNIIHYLSKFAARTRKICWIQIQKVSIKLGAQAHADFGSIFSSIA